MTDLAEEVGRMDERLKAIEDDVREIKQALTGRPSWAVSIYMTVITSAFVGVLVALLGHLSR